MVQTLWQIELNLLDNIDIDKETEDRISDMPLGARVKEKGELRNQGQDRNKFRNGKAHRKNASTGGGATIKDVDITLKDDGLTVEIEGTKSDTDIHGKFGP